MNRIFHFYLYFTQCSNIFRIGIVETWIFNKDQEWMSVLYFSLLPCPKWAFVHILKTCFVLFLYAWLTCDSVITFSEMCKTEDSNNGQSLLISGTFLTKENKLQESCCHVYPLSVAQLPSLINCLANVLTSTFSADGLILSCYMPYFSNNHVSKYGSRINIQPFPSHWKVASCCFAKNPL